MSIGAAISIRDLRIRYRGARGTVTEAVRGLSFDVAPGEIVGFLGPNGAGKSSTLKALMGFVEPTAGVCEVFGHRAGSVEAKSLAGYLPEVATYYPFLTPRETLRLYGELQGLSGKSLRTEADELLDRLGLSRAMNRQNRTMSKGMLQRVGIAQALLGSPRLLVLDEVTSGLDPVARQELRGLLKERQAAGTTLFFSSHELSEVDMLCDRILLVHRGKLIEERNVESLKEHLRRFELHYTGSANMIDLAAEWDQDDDGTRRARFETKPRLLEAIGRIQHSGGVVLDVVSQEGSLEQYFIDTVREAA